MGNETSTSQPPALPPPSSDEPLLSFVELARHLTRRRPGRKVAASTVWRWHRDGVTAADGTRIRLPAQRYGGAYVTTLTNAEWFADRLAWTPSATIAARTAKERSSSDFERVAQRLATPPSKST
jgi:hypothetical protein